jgi:hypothetical protein
MLMFLSLLLTGLAVTAVCAALLSASAPDERPSVEPEITVRAPRFFASDAPPALDPRAIPAELLLSHIERHVRLEQAAAERFVSLPTIESLQAPTESKFVN